MSRGLFQPLGLRVGDGVVRAAGRLVATRAVAGACFFAGAAPPVSAAEEASAGLLDEPQHG